MRLVIGIDIRALQSDHQYRGIGVYVRNLLVALSQVDHINNYRLYAYKGVDDKLAGELSPGFKYQIISEIEPPSHYLKSGISTVIRQPVQIKNEGLSVYLQTDISLGLPLGNFPKVAVAYDLIPKLFWKNTYEPSLMTLFKTRGLKGVIGSHILRNLYRWQLWQLARANAIISISNATKSDLLKHMHQLKPDRVHVVPLAQSRDFTFKPDRSVLNNLGIKGRYLLYVGAADYRKNIRGLVEAFEKVRAEGPELQLVLVGWDFGHLETIAENTKLVQALRDSPYKNDIIKLGFTPVKDIVALYSSATALVFPSLYEGFGIPILEAMACGCPVIAYDNSSIPEVAGNAAILVKSGEDLAPAITRVLNDKDLRTKMREAGLKQAAKFSWEQTAQETLKVLESVARR